MTDVDTILRVIPGALVLAWTFNKAVLDGNARKMTVIVCGVPTHSCNLTRQKYQEFSSL